jgi:hypothetical protein
VDEDAVSTIMEALFDIRTDVRHVIDLLEEDDDGREEEEES